jgi:hypothetical protein
LERECCGDFVFSFHRLDGGNNKKLVMELVECNEMGIMKMIA